MRISDWSSDVCSSDLQLGLDHVEPVIPAQMGEARIVMGQQPGAGGMRAPLVGESAKRPKRPRRDLANPWRQDRLIAVGLFDTLQFAGENIERLIPADTDPFIPATQRLVAPTGLPMLPDHRIFEPVSAQEPEAQRLPASACPKLRTIPAVLDRVVGPPIGRAS